MYGAGGSEKAAPMSATNATTNAASPAIAWWHAAAAVAARTSPAEIRYASKRPGDLSGGRDAREQLARVDEVSSRCDIVDAVHKD